MLDFGPIWVFFALHRCRLRPLGYPDWRVPVNPVKVLMRRG